MASQVLDFHPVAWLPAPAAVEDGSPETWAEFERLARRSTPTFSVPIPPVAWQTEVVSALRAAGIYDSVRHASPRAALADLIAYHTR